MFDVDGLVFGAFKGRVEVGEGETQRAAAEAISLKSIPHSCLETSRKEEAGMGQEEDLSGLPPFPKIQQLGQLLHSNTSRGLVTCSVAMVSVLLLSFLFKSSTRLKSDVSQMAVWADHENTQPRKLHFDQDYRVRGSQEVPGVVPPDDSGLNHS